MCAVLLSSAFLDYFEVIIRLVKLVSDENNENVWGEKSCLKGGTASTSVTPIL